MSAAGLSAFGNREQSPPLRQATGLQRAALRPVEVSVAALLIAMTCVVATWLLGKDLNWDYFNYHGYAAVSALESRVSKDFFAAGYQGYLNPLPFLPFALMQEWGWHSLAIGAGLGAIHSLNVLFLYLICREVAHDSPHPVRQAAALTLFGAASLPVVAQVGSTFIDPATTWPVMMSVWLVLRHPHSGRAHAASVALAGAATALKWTNAPYALALGVVGVLAVLPSDWKSIARRVALCSAAGMAGFLAFYAAWGAKLQAAHQSPVFPLFNALFRSPDAEQQSVALDRFVPQTLESLLLLPFRMVSHEAWIYTETAAPDLRPALLIILLGAALLARVAWKSAPHRMHKTARSGSPMQRHSVTLAVFLAISTVAWVKTSTNARYAIPLLLLLGPAIYLLARWGFGARAARIICLLALAIQLTFMTGVPSPRWNPQPWNAQWLKVDPLPEELTRAPALVVSVGLSSSSHLVRQIHPDSAFVNPIGLISIATNGPGWDRFVELRERYAGRTWILVDAPRIIREGPFAEHLAHTQAMVDRLQLQFEAGRCTTVQVNDDDQQPAWLPDRELLTQRLALCPASLKTAYDPVIASARSKAQEIMDAIDDRCPNVFLPRRPQIEGTGKLWTRLYGRFDLFLSLELPNGEIWMRQERQATPVKIGDVSTWQKDVARMRCELPHKGSRGISTLNGSDAAR
jgi:hypothetical protein